MADDMKLLIRVDEKQGVDFPTAFRELLAGRRIERESWDGEYIEVASLLQYEDPDGCVIRLDGGKRDRILAFVDQFDVVLGWMPSLEDMFAEDWNVFHFALRDRDGEYP